MRSFSALRQVRVMPNFSFSPGLTGSRSCSKDKACWTRLESQSRRGTGEGVWRDRDPPRLVPGHLREGLLQSCTKMQATGAHGRSPGCRGRGRAWRPGFRSWLWPGTVTPPLGSLVSNCKVGTGDFA